MNPLVRFTEDELLAELVRRRNATDIAKPEHWCHDCAHFEPWDARPRKSRTMPEDFNACSKGHAMRFVVPEGCPDAQDDWGFYRTVCADRRAA